MHDIKTRKDIERLVKDFYERAVADEQIGYIFTDVARIDLEHHLPIIADFWEMLLLGTVNFQDKYKRSAMQSHHALNDKERLRLDHFSRWVELFCETVDENFAGETAKLAKLRALSVAETMRIKFDSENGAEARAVRE